MLTVTTACGSSYRNIYPPTPPALSYETYVRARVLREHERYAEALQQVRIALAHDPESVRLRAEEADLMRLRDDLDNALEHALELWADTDEDDVGRTSAIHVYALVLRDVGRSFDAIEVLEQGLERHPDDFDLAFLRAELAIGADDLPAATRVLEAYVAANPGATRGWLALGNVAFEANDDAVAISAYEAYLDRDARSEHAWLRLAEAYRRSGQSDKQESVLAECVETKPTSHHCKVGYISVIVAHPEPADLEQRMEVLELAVPHNDVDIDDQQLANLSMRVLDQLPLEAASPFIERVLERRPGLIDLAYYLGVARFHAGDYSGALWALREIPDDSDLFTESRHLIGRAQLALGRVDAAGETADALLERSPDLIDGYLLASQVGARVGDFATARARVEAGIEAVPGREIELRLHLGDLLARAGQTDDAVEAYEAASAAVPSEGRHDPLGLPPDRRPRATAQHRRARVIFDAAADKVAVLDDVQALNDRALETLPEEADFLVLAARIERVRGNGEAARALLERALASQPGHAEAALRLGDLVLADDPDAAAVLYQQAHERATRDQIRELARARLDGLDARAVNLP